MQTPPSCHRPPLGFVVTKLNGAQQSGQFSVTCFSSILQVMYSTKPCGSLLVPEMIIKTASPTQISLDIGHSILVLGIAEPTSVQQPTWQATRQHKRSISLTLLRRAFAHFFAKIHMLSVLPVYVLKSVCLRVLLTWEQFASLGGFLFGYDQGVVSGVLTMESFGAKFPRIYMDNGFKGWFVSSLLLSMEITLCFDLN